MVDKLDREHLNFTVLFETTHIDVISLRNVQENTVNEKQERFNVQELTPTEAQIEEKLRQALIVNASFIQLLCFTLLFVFFDLPTFLKSCLFILIHKTLILLIKFFTTFLIFCILLVLILINLLQITANFIS
jgi:hypothetical protein